MQSLERRDLLAGEVVELLLTARTDDDQLIAPDENGVINLAVNEPFNLEVSYDDLRQPNIRNGVFQLVTDIVFSEGNIFEPMLNETQRLIVDAAILTQPFDTPGTLHFAIEDSPVTHVSPFLDFATDPVREIIKAMDLFGYTPDQYSVSTLEFEDGDLGFNIFFRSAEFADRDLPNISVTTENFDTPVQTANVEFAPRNPDGSINSDALRFNLDTLSRTFNSNERFFGSPSLSFDPESGFQSVRGLGALSIGGVRGLTDDGGFITPFDAYSLRVRFTAPANGLIASVQRGEDPESILLYGRNEPVLPEELLLDDDASITFNVSPGFDFGDAPDDSLSAADTNYPTLLEDDGARHAISQLYLGASIDSEPEGQPSLLANGDNESPGTDADGVVAITSLVANTSTAATASFMVTSSGEGVVDAWIDTNLDGDWDNDERLLVGASVPEGTSILSLNVPESTVAGQTFARFRLTSDGIDAPTGEAADGEVEDFIVEIADADLSPDVFAQTRGEASVVVVDGNIVVQNESVDIFRAPVDEIGRQAVLGSALSETISVEFSGGNGPAGGLEVDGREGVNTLEVRGSTSIDLSSAGNSRAHNFDVLDLTDSLPADVTLDASTIRSLSPDGALVRYVGAEGDTLTFRDASQWRMTRPIIVDQQFVLTARNQTGGERIEARVAAPFQNLVSISDVNNNGEVTAVDALTVINELARRSFSSDVDQAVNDPRTTIPWPGVYFDQSGDNRVTALDALRVINEIAQIANGAGELPAGAALAGGPQSEPEEDAVVSQPVDSLTINRRKLASFNWQAANEERQAIDQPSIAPPSSNGENTSSPEAVDQILTHEFREDFR